MKFSIKCTFRPLPCTLLKAKLHGGLISYTERLLIQLKSLTRRPAKQHDLWQIPAIYPTPYVTLLPLPVPTHKDMCTVTFPASVNWAVLHLLDFFFVIASKEVLLFVLQEPVEQSWSLLLWGRKYVLKGLFLSWDNAGNWSELCRLYWVIETVIGAVPH